MSKLMKKKGLRTFLIVVLVIIAFVLFFKLKGSSVSDNSDKYAGVDFDTMSSEYQREGQYSDYVAKRTDANTPSGSYDIPVAGFVKKETTKNVTVHNDLGPENEKSESVLIPEGESAVYSVNVEEEGYYNLNLEYYPSTGDKDDRGIAIETKVELYNEKTGKYKTPFNGAEGIDFERVYTDDGKPTKDNQGNEIRPSQIEDPTRGWISSYFEDPTGYEMDLFFRPPRGEYSKRTLQVAKDLGYTTIFWSMAYLDYDVNNQPTPEHVIEHFAKYYHPGAIPLIHNVSQANHDALKTVLQNLKKEGYTFGTLYDLQS